MSENDASTNEAQDEVPVSSLTKFLKWVAKHQADLDELNKSREDDNQLTLYFRGVKDKKYHLLPSIYRNGWVENEDVIFNECLCRNPRDFAEERTTFDKLVKMQHYGVPTRLLDITSNPLVALYFACEAGSTNAEIGRVNVFYVSAKAIKYSESNTVAAVSNLAVCPYDQMDIHDAVKLEREQYIDACARIGSFADINHAATLMKKAVGAFNERSDVARLVHAIQNEKQGFLPLVRKEHLESVWTVKPKLSNDRIVRQDGAFLLYGIMGSKMVSPSIVGMSWAMQCLNDVRKMHFLTTKISSYTQDEERFLSDVQDRYGISSDLIDRYRSKEGKKEIEGQYIGYGIRSYIASEAMAQMMSRGDELWEAVENADLARISEKIFNPILGKPDKSKTRSRMSYIPIETLHYLSQKVAEASFFYNVCQNDALIFCDSTSIANKKAVAKEIAPLGMTKDKLFPELDDVAEYLKEKYKKKDAAEKV